MWDYIGAAFLIGLAVGVLLTGAGRVDKSLGAMYELRDDES
jgi:uncharacterized membrane-anchored protein YhcB (DUF1043 family)